MSAGLDIVYLCSAERWWDWRRDGFVSRPAEIARTLATHPDVRTLLVVDPPWSLLRLRSPGPRGRPCVRVSPAVHVLDQPRLLPRERSDPRAYRLNGRLHDRGLLREVSRAASSLGMRRAVTWLTGPLVAKYAPCGEGPVVYDAMDEWRADDAQAAMRAEFERSYELIRDSADVVFAVSKELARVFEGGRPSVHLVPNGVDPGRFAAPAPPPRDLARLPRPRVGYLGSLQDRIDVGLVAEAARRLPHATFVFVGPVTDVRHLAPLRDLDNVVFLPPCAPRDVPACLAAFDVCMLPHVRSRLTRHMDPLKLYEYVAAGRPVVATDVAFDHPSELVRRTYDTEGFCEAIAEAIASGPRVPAVERHAYLERCTWRVRVDEMLRRVTTASSGPAARGVPRDRAAEWKAVPR